jgi:hypothetical protein
MGARSDRAGMPMGATRIASTRVILPAGNLEKAPT